MSTAAPPRFAFVLGTGRCGSTLVQEVLSRHPDVGFLTNLEDRLPGLRLGEQASRAYRSLPARWTTKGRVRFAPSEGYRVLDARVSPALTAPVRDLVGSDATPWLASRTRDFFEQHAAASGKDVFLHKFTGWPRAGFLQAVWPDCRFVHIVRDGRAVANSLLQMPWWHGWQGPSGWSFGPLPEPYAEEWEQSGRSFVVLAGLEWKVLMDAFRTAAAAVPDGSWLEMRYEDVVADPHTSFARLLAHCGLAMTSEFEQGLARHSFSSGRTAAYRADLAPADVTQLDRSLDGHLRRYGYDVG